MEKKLHHSEKCEVRTQQVGVLATKPNNLSLIPRTHRMEEKEFTPTGWRERGHTRKLLYDPNTYVVAHDHSPTHKRISMIFKM